MKTEKDFPHLMGAMNLNPTFAGKGMCFHRSAALVLDLEDAEVVMGTFRQATPAERLQDPNASGCPFIHCWVEYQGAILAPSLIEKMGNELRPMNRDHYYQINGAKDFYRITRKQLLAAAVGTGLSAHLKNGKRMTAPWTVGKLLLETAGVPYQLTAKGSVIPEGVVDA